MGGQVYRPPQTDEEKDTARKSAAEKSNRQWRLQNYMQSVTPGGGSDRMFDWSSMPPRLLIRR
jgi:hypothetical protein